jgi:phage terminase large subunit-like protein
MTHAEARATINHPALLEAFDADWYYPWLTEEWPAEDRQHPLVQQAINDGWAEWIESQVDLEAVKQGYFYDLSRDRDGGIVYWHAGSWCRWEYDDDGTRHLAKIPIEIAEDRDDPEVVHWGAGDIRCRFVELFINFTKESLSSDPDHPYRLLHWQRKLFLCTFGWVRKHVEVKRGKERTRLVRRYTQVYLTLAKKNGKSDLGSTLTLTLLRADGERKAYIYGCAAAKDQAGIVFREARDYVQASPMLADELFINDSRVDRKISHFASGSFYSVISAEGYRHDGYDAQAVLFDELHQQRDRKLYVILRRSGQARLQPLEFVMTTYGRTLKCIWGEVHLKCKAILQERRMKISQLVMIASAEPIMVVVMQPASKGVELIEVRRLEQPIDAGELIDFQLSETGSGHAVKVKLVEPAKRFQRFLRVEPIPGDIAQYSEGWANKNPLAPERLDHAILRANPSVDIVTPLERIKAEIQDAEGPQGEAEAKRFNLNIVTGDGELAFSGAAWQACGMKRFRISQLAGQRCFGGLDISQIHDLTAFWLAFPNWPHGQRFGKVEQPLVRLIGLVWVPSAEIEKREEVEDIPYRALAEQRYVGRFGPVRICEGETIDYRQVGQEIVELCEFFKVQAVAFDNHLSTLVVDPYLIPGGLRCYPQGQGWKLGASVARFSNMLKRHQIAHGNHPVLDAAVEGCVLRQDAVGNRWPAKDKSISRIDALVSAIMANGWACAPPREMLGSGAWSGQPGAGILGNG